VSDGKITRRALAPLAAGAAVAMTASCGPNIPTTPQSKQFPKDFKWGVATAAPQIEGSPDADGRGPSIWDVFAKKPGNIIDHSDASYACDSYRRYKDDVALIAGANLKAYRFSIAWPRVMPLGGGAVNDKGIDYYKRLTDALHEAGIEPFATLYHWDLPQALQDKGGWANRDTAYRLADYAAVVADKLGDRIPNFIILNEAAVHTIEGHVLGTGAPGNKGGDILGAVTHHQNLGQGLAIKAIRARRPSAKIGTTMALMPVRAEKPWWHVSNWPSAYAFDAVWNKAYLDPLFNGSYPFVFESFVKSVVKDGDLAITKQPIDFLGVNYYSPVYIKYDSSNPASIGPGVPPPGVELDAFGREIDPSGIGENLARVRDDYGNPPVFITENGCSDRFSNNPAVIDDGFRIDYLKRHMAVVKAEMENGSPVKGFFVWSLIDNWEWNSGYTSKFGMVAMNRTTGVRTRKKSYDWYAALAKAGVLG
jgi:beta-glucosidase